jgi:hypothetical protein
MQTSEFNNEIDALGIITKAPHCEDIHEIILSEEALIKASQGLWKNQ